MMNYSVNFDFPVGYHSIHTNTHFNFQMNRWVSLGYARLQDFQKVAPKINTFNDWKKYLIELAEEAKAENRLINAAFYYRAAEFFLAPSDPDKLVVYDKFSELFYSVFQDDQVTRSTIPYENGFLPVLHFNPDMSKGVIVIHGGLDSFIEEFYTVALYLMKNRYEVIMFEGPGQGAALRKHNLFMTYQWEKPVRTILDSFQVDDVTLIGISLGGYLAPRAAAFEERINRVIAYDVYVYDHFNKSGFVGKLLTKIFFKTPSLYNRLVYSITMKSLIANWVINQWMYITNKNSPAEWGKQLINYSVANIASQITQDVLLLAGKEDHMVPLKNYNLYMKGLTNARSVSGRVFTKEEHGQNHCQVGNIKLVIDEILDWIQGKTN